MKESYQKARLHFQWRNRLVEQTKRDKATPEKKKERRLNSKRCRSRNLDGDEVSNFGPEEN